MAVALLACLHSAEASAASTDEALAAATEAYSEGNYRQAAAQLNELSRQSPQLSPEQKLSFWDLSANVTEASGLFIEADKAARTHLQVLQTASAANAGALSPAERNALVRIARIKRTLAGAEPTDNSITQRRAALLNEAMALLQKALKSAGSNQPRRPLWESETRFEFARTLESLGNAHDAAQQYLQASSLAEESLDDLELSDEMANELERAIAVIRQAAPVADEAASRRQASTALRLIERQLNSSAVTQLLRGQLLAARAACIRQLNDPRNERRILDQIIAQTGQKSEIEPLVRAKALFRLAELADRDAATQHDKASRQQADAFYAQAANVYKELMKSAMAAAHSSERKKRIASRATQAECLMQLQLIHTRVADWPSAIRAAKQLLDLRSKSLITHGDPSYYRTLASLGALHAKRARSALISASAGDGHDLSAARSDGRTAQKYLKPACEFWRHYQPHSAAELATALNHRAEVLRYDGEFRQADELLREAEPYCRSAYESGDLRLGEYYSNHAAVQAALGLYALALDNYDLAITIANVQDAADIRERRRLLAMVYLNKAQLHKSQRQLSDARVMCDKASQAAINAGLGDADVVPFELARASLLIAEAEQNYARSIAGDPAADETPTERQAYALTVRENLTEAAQITVELLANTQVSNPLQLATARHLGALANYRLFELCGADEGALQAAEASWKQIAQPQDLQGQPGIDILRVRALNHLVALALRDVAHSRAKASAASRRDDADDNFVQLLSKHSEARLQEAETASKAAEELAKAMVAYPAVRAQALFGRAQVLNAAARIHRAKARRHQDEDADDNMLSAEHQTMAKTKTEEAIQVLRASLEIIELPRAMTVGAEEERAEYLAQFAPTFDLLFDLLMEQGRYVEAIQESEKRRSRTFQDQLAAGGVDMYATANKQHVLGAQELRDKYYTTLEALRQSWDDDARRAQLSQSLEQLQREFVAAERAVKSSSQAARQLLVESAATKFGGTNEPLQTERWVSDQIGEGDVAIVYYIGAERSYIVVCGKQLGVHGMPLTITAEQAHRRGLWMPKKDGDQAVPTRPLRSDDVLRLVNDIRAWAERPMQNQAGQEVALKRGPGGLRQTVSAKIGPEQLFVATEILLPTELRKKIAAAQPAHLIIVPDGALHQLPFELLPTDTERSTYLLDELPPICYAPSMHIYRMLREDTNESASPLTLLSVADPDYNVASDSLAATARDLTSVGQEFHHYWDGRLSRLESAAEELAEVTAAFKDLGPGRMTVVPLANRDASEQKLRESLQAQPVHMLHIAAHGLVTQRHNNLFGALALTTQPHPTAADDGFVALHEVFNLPLRNCNLAVLSACQTNCGPESPLEAGSTLARAFLCAGARRVVCSHWSVSDKATAPLIGSFMRNVARDLRTREAVDYATALHAAKLRLRNEPLTSAPYFWAPFVLIGPPIDANAVGDSLALDQ